MKPINPRPLDPFNFKYWGDRVESNNYCGLSNNPDNEYKRWEMIVDVENRRIEINWNEDIMEKGGLGVLEKDVHGRKITRPGFDHTVDQIGEMVKIVIRQSLGPEAENVVGWSFCDDALGKP